MDRIRITAMHCEAFANGNVKLGTQYVKVNGKIKRDVLKVTPICNQVCNRHI